MTRIDEIMKELPLELQQEVVDFTRFLLALSLGNKNE
jgi:hypothetical protein